MASARSKPSASSRSRTLRRMYSLGVMHLRCAARSISGVTRAGQRNFEGAAFVGLHGWSPLGVWA